MTIVKQFRSRVTITDPASSKKEVFSIVTAPGLDLAIELQYDGKSCVYMTKSLCLLCCCSPWISTFGRAATPIIPCSFGLWALLLGFSTSGSTLTLLQGSGWLLLELEDAWVVSELRRLRLREARWALLRERIGLPSFDVCLSLFAFDLSLSVEDLTDGFRAVPELSILVGWSSLPLLQ